MWCVTFYAYNIHPVLIGVDKFMASHKITLSGQAVAFDCDEGDTLLRAALRAGLAFPYECNSGGCGSCKFELLTGHVDNIWPEAPGLSDRDIKKGRQLSCQCVPTEDCDLKLRLNPKFTPKHSPVKSTAKLYEIRPITDDMIEFCFHAEHEARFEPGQFALLDIPEVQGSRAYSMSNVPNGSKQWHFIIKKMPGGQGSGRLFEDYKLGDTVSLDGPYGMSFLQADVARDIVCVAGGSGLSPEMAIIKGAVLEPRLDDQAIYLFYGGRTPQDICPPALINADENLSKRVQNFNVVSDIDAAKASGWRGDVGYVHELLSKKLTKPLAEYEYYVCGPQPMTDALLRLLIVEHQVPLEQINYDRFY